MNGHEVDPRLHAYLDGELSASEAQAFEGDLRPGSTLWNQLECLKQLRAWFRATQPRAPSNLSRAVVGALELEVRTRDRALGSRADRRRWASLRPRLAWVGLPAAIAAAVALIVLLPLGRDGGLPPSPAIETTHAADPGSLGPNTVRYVFTVKADRAREICLAGDFNHWKVCDAPLTRVGENLWSIAIELPRGRHEYMFVVDGRWVTDPSAMGYAEDGFGNRNALLVI